MSWAFLCGCLPGLNPVEPSIFRRGTQAWRLIRDFVLKKIVVCVSGFKVQGLGVRRRVFYRHFRSSWGYYYFFGRGEEEVEVTHGMVTQSPYLAAANCAAAKLDQLLGVFQWSALAVGLRSLPWGPGAS